jgi:DNA repair protein RadC
MLVYNQPSGDDIETTEEIAKAAEALGISIHDPW